MIVFFLFLCCISAFGEPDNIKETLHNAFDDSILYGLRWADEEKLSDPQLQSYEIMKVKTANNEEYQCMIPDSTPKLKMHDGRYSGLSPLDILMPLFSQSSCTYRLEAYWTYEICHGRHIRQYHEERDGKRLNKQAYYLGKWTDESYQTLNARLEIERELGPTSIPQKRIDGVNVPVLQLNYTDGTLCDLSGSPRRTDVLYVCYDQIRQEVYSIKEIATCHYEIIVFTAMLCLHPWYRPRVVGEKEIFCIHGNEYPIKPKALQQIEAQGFKINLSKKKDSTVDKIQKVFAVISFPKEEETVYIEGGHRIDVTPQEIGKEEAKPTDHVKPLSFSPFQLDGDCIYGGNDYWKFEFCYGRHVDQYHIEGGVKTSIRLGSFDEKKHRLWMYEHPERRPTRDSLSVSHYYSSGTFCDTRQRNRDVEVRLKCKKNEISPTSIVLYMLEPNVCSYVLTVESPIICNLLPYMDPDGLFNVPSYNHP